MKHLITILLFIFISGCSVHIVEMAEQPTVQKYDLTDADSDGVIQAREKCADSFAGVKVDNDGCSSHKKTTIKHELVVNFDSNSYAVKPEYYPAVKELADYMNADPSSQVTIEGHTSTTGTRDYNQILSQKRAQAVKDLLIADYGIAADRITPIGYGFDQPIAEGNDEFSNAHNRRIVAVISTDKEFKNLKWTIYSVDQNEE